MSNERLEYVLALVNAGGWRLCGGRKATINTAVTGAEIVSEVLVLHNGAEAIASVNVDRLSVRVTGGDRPHLIEFVGPFMNKQQRKKVDGGGWHEVERIGTVVELVHTEAQARHEAEEAQRRASEMAAAEARKEEDAWRWIEERNARVAAFVARQKEQMLGARIVDLTGGPDGLTITFDNGHALTVELDGGDTYDAWLNVGGGGEKISLASGTKPDY